MYIQTNSERARTRYYSRRKSGFTIIYLFATLRDL